MLGNKFVCLCIHKTVLICVLLFSFQCAVNAAIVSTPDLIAHQGAESKKQELIELLKRELKQEHVQSRLIELGVDPENALQRVDNLTADEVQQLASQMDELPAGSGVVGTVAFVFVVLLITDILGYTDIFPFVKKTVH
ncbi:MAG: PA2779 family protein [Gammaproteobacteria bacterium]|nr:PA2779 family protein [Gammaproteobacteria bacterium]